MMTTKPTTTKPSQTTKPSKTTTVTTLAMAMPAMALWVGCSNGEPLHVTGQATQGSLASAVAAGDLEVRMVWQLPSEAARDGETQEGETAVGGHVTAGVRLSGELPSAFRFDVDPPPPEAMITREGEGSWANGFIVATTPAAFELLANQELPSAETPFGTGSLSVVYFEDVASAAFAGLATPGLAAGFNLVAIDAEAAACVENYNAIQDAGYLALDECLASAGCPDDGEACSQECRAQTVDPAIERAEQLDCPYSGLRAMPLDTESLLEMSTVGELQLEAENENGQ